MSKERSQLPQQRPIRHDPLREGRTGYRAWYVEVRGGSGGGGGGLDDAPSDGLIYTRQDGQWVEITQGGGSGGPVEWADVLNDAAHKDGGRERAKGIHHFGWQLLNKGQQLWQQNLPETRHGVPQVSDFGGPGEIAIDLQNYRIYTLSLDGQSVEMLGSDISSETIDWSQLDNVPTEFNPAPHEHEYTEINNGAGKDLETEINDILAHLNTIDSELRRLAT